MRRRLPRPGGSGPKGRESLNESADGGGGGSCAMAASSAGRPAAAGSMARRRDRCPLHLDVGPGGREEATAAADDAAGGAEQPVTGNRYQTAAASHGLTPTPTRISAQFARHQRPRQRARMRSASPAALLSVLGLLGAAIAPTALAQDDPTASPTSRVCACSPTIYRWTLNFTSFCPPPDVSICPTCGINVLFCDLRYDDEVTDLIPEIVESYTVLELDAGFQVIKQFLRGGLELRDGDEIEYVSITAGGDEVPVENRPAFLQMSVEGRNAEGEELQSQWIVSFTRRCDVLPFKEGDGISWSIFNDLVPPRPELCDVSPPPTSAPTSEPTEESTPEPSPPPSPAPTEVESTPSPTEEESTPSPTRAPVETEQPTLVPSPSPTRPTLTLAPLPTRPPSTEPPEPTRPPTPRPTPPKPEPTPSPSVMSMGYGGNDLVLDWPMDDMDELSSSSAHDDEYGRSSKKKSRKRGSGKKKDSREGGHTDLSERSDKKKSSGGGSESESGDSSSGKKKKPTKRGRSRKRHKTHSHSKGSSSSKRESRKRKRASSHDSSSSSSHGKKGKKSHKHNHKHKKSHKSGRHSKGSKSKGRSRRLGQSSPLRDNASELLGQDEMLRHTDYAVEGFDPFDVMRLEMLDRVKRAREAAAAAVPRRRRERGWNGDGPERVRR